MEQATALANISQKFGESGIAVPVLSAFESKPIKMGRSFWISKPRIVCSLINLIAGALLKGV